LQVGLTTFLMIVEEPGYKPEFVILLFICFHLLWYVVNCWLWL